MCGNLSTCSLLSDEPIDPYQVTNDLLSYLVVPGETVPSLDVLPAGARREFFVRPTRPQRHGVFPQRIGLSGARSSLEVQHFAECRGAVIVIPKIMSANRVPASMPPNLRPHFLTFGETRKTSFPLRKKTTPVGFEPTRAEPTGLAGRRLNLSAKVSSCRRNHDVEHANHNYKYSTEETNWSLVSSVE